MVLVIDGYNLIKQLLGVSRVPEERRTACIKELAAYAKHKKHELILIFDGGALGHPWQEQVAGATVIYSGYRESADDVIKDYLVKYRARSPMLISSDRELRDYANKLGQKSMTVSEFSRGVSANSGVSPHKQPQVRLSHGQLHKTSKNSDQGLDDLMTQASRMTLVKPQDTEYSELQDVGKKKNKREREIERLRKKL